ncbi:hypothetical protein ACFV2N_47150, partial [Streptomyces sp. NPDC059680]|uniref:hypothetical protein n=1 Tax=Streptomyces sp. NPDC059680 TaxID=3346904 RepID=UPI0036B11B5F
MAARHKKVRKTSTMVASRYAAISLGTMLGIGAASVAPAMAAAPPRAAVSPSVSDISGRISAGSPVQESENSGVPFKFSDQDLTRYFVPEKLKMGGYTITYHVMTAEGRAHFNVDKFIEIQQQKPWYRNALDILQLATSPLGALIGHAPEVLHSVDAKGNVVLAPEFTATRTTKSGGTVEIKFKGLSAGTKFDVEGGELKSIEGNFDVSPSLSYSHKTKDGKEDKAFELSGLQAGAGFKWSKEKGLESLDGHLGVDLKLKAIYKGYGVEVSGFKAQIKPGWNEESGIELEGEFDAKPKVMVNVPGLGPIEASGFKERGKFTWSQAKGFSVEGDLGFAPVVTLPIPDTKLTIHAEGLDALGSFKYSKEKGLEVAGEFKIAPKIDLIDRATNTKTHVEGLKGDAKVSWSKEEGFKISGGFGGDAKLRVEKDGNGFELSGLSNGIHAEYGTKGGFKVNATEEFAPTVKVFTKAGYSGELKGLKINGELAYSSKDGWKVDGRAMVVPQLKLTGPRGDILIEGPHAGVHVSYKTGEGWKFEGDGQLALKVTVTPKNGTPHEFETPSISASYKDGKFSYETKGGEGNLKDVEDIFKEAMNGGKEEKSGEKPVDESKTGGSQAEKDRRPKRSTDEQTARDQGEVDHRNGLEGSDFRDRSNEEKRGNSLEEDHKDSFKEDHKDPFKDDHKDPFKDDHKDPFKDDHKD